MSYTFKDDGSALTYYREYNKEVGTGDKTLVGNWVEERALRDEIKTGRYQVWTNPDPNPTAFQKSYTKFTTRPDASDSYFRTMVHTDHIPAKDFVSSNQVPDPGYAVYKNPEKGVRTQMMERRAMELAVVSAPREEPMPPQFTTTTQEDFSIKELPPADELGRRVMMTQNMQDIRGAGDAIWRMEKGLVSASLVVGQMAANLPPDVSLKPSYNTTSGDGVAKDATFSTPTTEILKFGPEIRLPTDKYYRPE